MCKVQVSKAKVEDPDCSGDGKENVFGLDIAVYDAGVV
jgi:hypothetical protein